MARVTAVVQVQSLVQEFLHAVREAKKKGGGRGEVGKTSESCIMTLIRCPDSPEDPQHLGTTGAISPLPK